LLEEMQTATNRKARFVTVITLIANGELHTFEGEVKGTIAHVPKGNKGFGYDPLFIPTGYRSTFAELGSEVKNEISHRAKAVSKLIAFLMNES
jgi:XTP/dITP diphosphohydrolase